MKFTAALLLAAVLYLGSVDARGGKRKRNRDGKLGGQRTTGKKKAKVDGTVATCGVNLDKESWDAGLAVGKTMFWQLDATVNDDGTVTEAPVIVGSKWGNLAKEDTHTFSFFDSDAPDCDGTELASLKIDGF